MQNYHNDPRDKISPFTFAQNNKPPVRLAEAYITAQQFNGILPLERVLMAGTAFAELEMAYAKSKKREG